MDSVYFVACGGAAALLARCVASSETVAYADLGTEALRRIEVVDFPVFVGVDTDGDDVYGSSSARRAQRLIDCERGTVDHGSDNSTTARRGLFITFEGGDGAGKSTHIRFLADALRTPRARGREPARAGRHAHRREAAPRPARSPQRRYVRPGRAARVRSGARPDRRRGHQARPRPRRDGAVRPVHRLDGRLPGIRARPVARFRAPRQRVRLPGHRPRPHDTADGGRVVEPASSAPRARRGRPHGAQRAGVLRARRPPASRTSPTASPAASAWWKAPAKRADTARAVFGELADLFPWMDGSCVDDDAYFALINRRPQRHPSQARRQAGGVGDGRRVREHPRAAQGTRLSARQRLLHDRVSHAYLFTGPAGFEQDPGGLSRFAQARPVPEGAQRSPRRPVRLLRHLPQGAPGASTPTCVYVAPRGRRRLSGRADPRPRRVGRHWRPSRPSARSTSSTAPTC